MIKENEIKKCEQSFYSTLVDSTSTRGNYFANIPEELEFLNKQPESLTMGLTDLLMPGEYKISIVLERIN